MGLVGEVSGARLRDELVAILDEPVLAATLARMHELVWTRRFIRRSTARPRRSSWSSGSIGCGPSTQPRAARLAGAVGRDRPGVAAGRTRAVAGVAAVRRRDARAVALAAVLPARLLAPLGAPRPPPTSPSCSRRTARGRDVTAALGSRPAREYLSGVPSVTLELDGDVAAA